MFKTQYMPIYLGDSYKLVAVRVYPIGEDSFIVENLNPTNNKRFNNLDFMAYVDNIFFNKFGYKGA